MASDSDRNGRLSHESLSSHPGRESQIKSNLGGLDEVLRGAIRGIDERDLSRIAPRRIDREDNQRSFNDFRNRAPCCGERKQLAGTELNRSAEVH